jgi:hypothetical protein
VTFIPANEFIGVVLSRWPDACYGVFSDIAGGYCYPVQGAPTILDSDTNGKVCVFDVKANGRGVGAPLSELVRLANDAYPTTALARIEKLGVRQVAAPDAGATQAAAAQTTADTQKAGSVAEAVKSAGKWLLVGLAVVAVIILASKAPKLGA